MKPLQIVHIGPDYHFVLLCFTAAFQTSVWHLWFYTRMSKAPLCGLYPSLKLSAPTELSSLQTKRTKYIILISKKFPLLTSCHLLCFSFIFKPSHLYPDVQLTFPLHFKVNISAHFFIFTIFELVDKSLFCFASRKIIFRAYYSVSKHLYLSCIHLLGTLPLPVQHTM